MGDIDWMKNIRFHPVFSHGSVSNENALFIRRAGFLRSTSLYIADGWGRVLCIHSQTHTHTHTHRHTQTHTQTHRHTHTYTVCVKQITAEKLLYNTGSPGWVLCDDLDEWDWGEAGSRGR